MSADQMALTDQRLEMALNELAGHPDPSRLVTDVMWIVDTTPQSRRGWSPRPVPRAVVLLAAALLLAAVIAGTLAVGTGLIRLPWLETDPLTIDTPHGNGEVAVHGEGCSILGLDGPTSGQREITSGFPACYPRVGIYEMAWSPQGDRLAVGYEFFCGGCGSPEANAAIDAKIDGIWLIDPATGDANQLVQCPSDCLAHEVTWSPDGSRLAYTESVWVWTVPADGGAPVNMSADEAGPAAHPSWSPDGRWLAFAVGGIGDRNSLVVTSADAVDRSIVFESDDGIPASLGWSPDGRRLLLASNAAAPTIRAVDADGSTSNVLFAGPQGTRIGAARWSPDGTRIAFAQWTLVETDGLVTITDLTIWTMAADGSDRKVAATLRTASAVSDPGWSPDGSQLTFAVSGTTGQANPGAYVVGIDGSGLSQVGTLGFEATPGDSPMLSTPAWRPVEHLTR